MIIVDTRQEKIIHPLIIALEAYFTTPKGKYLEIVFESNTDFGHLKDYLSSRSIGFREIYTGNELRLQVQKKNQG